MPGFGGKNKKKDMNSIEAIKDEMKKRGLKRKDLLHIFKHKSTTSQVFSGKRRLTFEMVEKLHKELGIPYETLIEGK